MRVEIFERDQWERWQDVPGNAWASPDVYFRAEYVATGDVEGFVISRCVVAQEGADALFVPYLWSAIPDAPGLHDVVGAYGYGGPVATSESPCFLAAAWAAIEDRWRADGGVAAFLRLHPLLENSKWLGPGWDTRDDRVTVSIDLSAGLENAFGSSAQKTHRSQVARARQRGEVVPEVPCGRSSIEEFRRLYDAMLGRMDAKVECQFTDAYWVQFEGRLSTSSSIFRVGAEPGPLTMALVLWGERWAHYHLAARNNLKDNTAGNLLLQGIAESALRRGRTAVHMGGGRTRAPDDDLLLFKRRVGGCLHRFQTAGRTLHEARFDALVNRWREFHPGGEPRWTLAYREP